MVVTEAETKEICMKRVTHGRISDFVPSRILGPSTLGVLTPYFGITPLGNFSEQIFLTSGIASRRPALTMALAMFSHFLGLT